MQAGFTLIELLIVIVLVVAACTIVFYNYSAHRNGQAFNNGEDDVISLINEARSRTLDAEGDMQYGVHFETNKAILFAGTSFSAASSTSEEVDFDATVTLSSINLAGSSQDVVFDQLTGDTDDYGTLVLSSGIIATPKTITITKEGFASGN